MIDLLQCCQRGRWVDGSVTLLAPSNKDIRHTVGRKDRIYFIPLEEVKINNEEESERCERGKETFSNVL